MPNITNPGPPNKVWQIRYGRIPYILAELIGCLAMMLFAIHLFSCGWYMLTTILSRGSAGGQPPWVQKHAHKEGLGSLSEVDLYGLSIYYATMTLTTIGYGDTEPSTVHERWTSAIIFQLGSAAFYAYVIALATLLTTSLRRNELKHEVLD